MATTLIKEIHQKGSTGSTAIGVNGDNVKLNTAQPNSGTITNASVALNASNAIYYNNTQAEMYRKGVQIANLNSSISNLTDAAANYITKNMVNGTPSTDKDGNKILTQNSDIQIQDNKVILTGNDSTGSKKAIIEGTSAPNTAAISSLAAAIPYMVQVNPASGSSTVQSYNSTNSNDFFIKGQDGLQNIGKKFNALRNTVNSMSTSSMSEDELIRRYYQNKQHYIVYNSNITAYEGYPSTDSRFLPQGASTEKPLLPGGFTRYMVYETSEDWTPTINATIDSAAKGYTTGGSWTGSTYTGPITNYPTLKQDNNGKYILKDKDKLPTPPDGYMWVCEYVRGTFTHNNKNMLWIKKDGFYTYNGYVTGSSAGVGPIISCDIPVQNLYKGTSFTNLTDMLQDTDQWKATNLCSGNFYQRDDGQIGSILNDYAGTKIKLYLTNSTSTPIMYQYHRLAEKRSYRFGGVASSISGDTVKTFQRIGNKYNQEDRIRLEARCGHSTAMSNGKYVYGSYFCTTHGLSDYDTLNWKSAGVFGASCLNMPLCFIFTTPFMYAEYTLVSTATTYDPLYWFNPSQDTNYTEDEGDNQNQSFQDS